MAVFSAILIGYILFFEHNPRGSRILNALGIHPRWMVALLVLVAAAVLPFMLRQSRPLLQLLPRLTPSEFRHLLIPHLATCGSYLAFCAGLFITDARDAARPKGEMHPVAGILLMGLMLGGLIGGVFSIRWFRRRWAAFRLSSAGPTRN